MQASGAQKRPAAAAAAEPAKQAAAKQAARRKSHLLDVAWTASAVPRQPPPEKQSSRQITAAVRALSPRILSPGRFPGWQRPQPAAAPFRQAAAQLPQAAAALAAALEPPRSASPLPVVSAAPPQLPELPPIAPLDLQPLRVTLTAEVPPPAAGGSGSAYGRQQPASRLPVQTAAPLSALSSTFTAAPTNNAWATTGPFYLSASRAPAKRPGEDLRNRADAQFPYLMYV